MIDCRARPIYLPSPAVGMRGLHEAVVTALGGTPRYHTSSLMTQADDGLPVEVAECGRTPIIAVDESRRRARPVWRR